MRKSERRKTAAARQATTQTAEAQPAQWRTTQETLIMAQISRTKLHKATKAGTFPKPINIKNEKDTTHKIWTASSVYNWMQQKAEERSE